MHPAHNQNRVLYVKERKKYDYLVFIMRAQPFHNGHKKVIDRALDLAERVIVLIGSAFEARSFRNPFTYHERESMVADTYLAEDIEKYKRLVIKPLADTLYVDNQWLVDVQTAVDEEVYNPPEWVDEQEWARELAHGDRQPVVGLIGHSKDHTGYYLKAFPQWDSEEVPGYDDQRLLDATWIRELYFTENQNSQTMELVLPAVVPSGTFNFLMKFHNNEHALANNDYEWIVGEHVYAENYKKPYAALPWEAVFTTVDAVVVQSGHVLLVERRARPGKGLFALPGGFLKKNKTIYESMIAELTEETKLKVAERTIKGSIAGFEVFDIPYRSARGRVITNAYLINLEPQPKLPKVRGGSDARRAFWEPIGGLERSLFFEDHYHIIRKMTAGM